MEIERIRGNYAENKLLSSLYNMPYIGIYINVTEAIVRITVVMFAERYSINVVCVRTEGNNGVS